MFSLIVKNAQWVGGHDRMPNDRVLEYTDESLVTRFRTRNQLHLEALTPLPALFMEEDSPTVAQFAHVGAIIRAKVATGEVSFEYTFDSRIQPIPNDVLRELAGVLEIDKWEFSRTHWAVKDADLFRALLSKQVPAKPKPQVFNLSQVESIDPQQVSVMMPFAARFDDVYTTLRKAAKATGFRCERADDIWENPSVIQDVVSLIDRSRVVICDCTGRNPNVFYEAGIAHTLGREVILITQAGADIPFDVSHLRYVEYLPNEQGLGELAAKIKSRLSSLS